MTDSLDEKIADATRAWDVLQLADALRAKGHPIPKAIAEIPGFPCRTFDDLQDALEVGRLLLTRLSFNYDHITFRLIATGGERVRANLYMYGTILITIASVVLAVMYSWWWLFGVAVLFIGFRKTKSLYNRVIFRAASSSETIFCYLYFSGQVSVSTPDNQQSFYWKSDDE